MDIELVARVEEQGAGLKRVVIVLIGIAALIVALLATLQLHASEQRQMLEAEASRAVSFAHASDVSTNSLGSLVLLNSFEEYRLLDSFIMKSRSDDPDVRAVAKTERRVFNRIVFPYRQASTEEAPSNTNLPTYAQRALSSDLTKQEALNHATELRRQQSERYANRERTLEVTLFFAAIATGLLALAGLTASRSTGRLCLVVAVISLASSSALGIGAVVG
jgi:hypothetical protein